MTTWHTIDDEFPDHLCRRCDVAYYADDDGDERIHWQAPSGVVHIERDDIRSDQVTFSAGLLIRMQGDRPTYCGLRVA